MRADPGLRQRGRVDGGVGDGAREEVARGLVGPGAEVVAAEVRRVLRREVRELFRGVYADTGLRFA